MGSEEVRFLRGAQAFKFCIIFLLYMANHFAPIEGFVLKNCYVSRNEGICVSKKLGVIPRDLPKTLEKLDFTNNKLHRIQSSDFPSFPVLTKLDLKHNPISNLGKAAFSTLISLQLLNLNYNRLQQLGDNVFDGLGNLIELQLRSNNLKSVTTTSFNSLTNLTSLDLSYNSLTKIETVAVILQQTPKLQTLQFIRNSIKTFYSSELTNHSLLLNTLDICQNNLYELRISANVFPNLTYLNFGGFNSNKPMKFYIANKTFLNQVSRLDVSSVPMTLHDFKTLFEAVNSSLTILRMNGMKKNLTELIEIACSIPTLSNLALRKNHLTSIHSDLFKSCIFVTELNLAKNQINFIDEDAFRYLHSLRTLILSQNALVSVPSAVRYIPLLSELDLSNNRIAELSCKDFHNLTRLTELQLQNNSLKALKECFFEDLTKLQVLKLQNNAIKLLNGAFKNNSLLNLRELLLFGNKLSKIVSEEFKGLSSLKNISLFQNNIKVIYVNSFFGLTNLTELLLQSNSVTEEHLHAFRVLISLKRLDLSVNKIHYPTQDLIHPIFTQLSSLEELSIASQHTRGKAYIPPNFLQGLTNLTVFRARNSQLLSLHKDTFTFTPKLELLDISSNDIFALSSDIFSPIRHLKQLYVSMTNLMSLDFFVDGNLTNLEFLQARKNQFSIITEDVVKSLPGLRYVDLMGNSFTCDCDNAFFSDWVRKSEQTQIFDGYNLNCSYPKEFKHKTLLDVDLSSCSVDIGFYFFVVTSVATLCLMVASLTYHLLGWQMVYAYYIFLAWLFDAKQKNKRASYQYDAFISYNTYDEPWVIGELLPKLEGQQGWRLCLHHRDFEPGKSIVENITDAIYGSRKTICVISHRYLESEWCSREVQTASFRLFDEQKDVLILLFLEDIPTYLLSPYQRMRKLLKRQTYLSWPRAEEKPEVFWEKLRQALMTDDKMNEGSFLQPET